MNRRRLLVLLSIAALAAMSPAQNLLAWNGWTQIAAQYQRGYSATAARITFNPYCPRTTCQNPVKTGLTQTVRVPKAGLYQFRFEGWGGGTGYFPTQYTIHTRGAHSLSCQNWHIAETMSLPAGNVTVTIMTQTSDFRVDIWNCVPPSLVPVIEPVVDVTVHNAGDPVAVRAILSTKAHVLAASFTSPSAPIKIPGFGHGLHLDPNGLVILAISSRGGIRLDLYRAVSSLGTKRWPKIYLQGLSPTTFGSRSWF